jgi:hypothetical protein
VSDALNREPTRDELQDEFNASMALHRRPPPPRYSKEMLKKMESEQHLFRCPVVLYTHPDHKGTVIKVSARDDQKRLDLASKGWIRSDEPNTPAGGSIRIHEGNVETGMPEDLDSMKKKDVLDLAKKLGIPNDGTMDEVKAKIAKKQGR